MDPNYSFNSKPTSGFTRPPRLAKHRKPFSANRPKGTFFTQNVESNDRVIDDLMKLKIQTSSTSSSIYSGGSRDGCGLRGVDESVVSELPVEMRQLYIGSEVFGKGYGGNVGGGDLPNKMTKLNVKDDGGLDNVFQDKLKDLKIKDLSSSLNENENDGSKFVFGNSGAGVGEVSSVYNADKKFEFGFTRKLDDKVEFKTPEPKGGFVFGFNAGSKKKKGNLNKTVQVPLVFGQGVGFQGSSQNYSEISEQYSPMEVSPYEEKLAGDVVSREASVASDESSHIDDNFSSTDEHPNLSNDMVDEHANLSNDMADEQLVSVTERLHINEPDVRVSEVRDESTEEGGFSGAETESFISANEELDYSCESFITARDDELSSASLIERQNSDARSKFKYDTSLSDTGQSSFIFGASSTNRSEFSSSLSSQKKKNRMRVGLDLYGSTSNVKNSHISALLSPEKDKKSNLSNPLRYRMDESKQVGELEAKLKSNTTASIAAQESCEKWRLRGNQAYAKAEFLKAEECYTQGINCISENEVSESCRRALLLCYSNRAATRMSLGRVREALQDCKNAAALDPSFLKVQVRAGSCYLAIGDVENASLHFMKCLQSGSDACADRKLLVEASDGLEKTRKVAECMKQAEELLRQRTSHDTDSASRFISEALAICSQSEKLLQMKVDALLMLKKYEELIQFCEQLLSMESNFLATGVDHSLEFNGSDLKSAPSFRVWCCALMLKSYFLLGRLEQAVEFVKRQEELVSLMERNESKNLESTIQLVGTIHELLRHKTAGNEAYQSGNHSEAIEHYTACISCSVESRPFSAICFCNRAAAYRAMGQMIDALADCTLAIALDVNYFKAIARRATLYETIRDYGQAITDLQKLIALLKKEVDKKTSQSEPADTKRSCVNELREAQVKLSEMEEAARKETPLNMYLILGVDPSAAASEIRKAYRKAALKYHPDKAGQSVARNEIGDNSIWKEIAEEVHKDADRLFIMIGEAYAVLSDPTKRAQYDMEEEQRKLSNRGHGVSSSKMYSDFNSYSFEKGGSRRQWKDVRRTYENSYRYF